MIMGTNNICAYYNIIGTYTVNDGVRTNNIIVSTNIIAKYAKIVISVPRMPDLSAIIV